ncbi:MAG TPA: GNAT family N-acetyltransferase [Frankiaceae bacterium]|nr:GNAT family N-acetyltransferase [Frankiaceae bacterium]
MSDAARTVVTDHPENGRFEIAVDGELAGFASYHRVGENLDFTHTEIDDRFEGQGLGSTLIRAGLEAARERGMGVLPHCPFVRSFIERHAEFLDLVPAARRPDFGLDG